MLKEIFRSTTFLADLVPRFRFLATESAYAVLVCLNTLVTLMQDSTCV